MHKYEKRNKCSYEYSNILRPDRPKDLLHQNRPQSTRCDNGIWTGQEANGVADGPANSTTGSSEKGHYEKEKNGFPYSGSTFLGNQNGKCDDEDKRYKRITSKGFFQLGFYFHNKHTDMRLIRLRKRPSKANILLIFDHAYFLPCFMIAFNS